MMYYQSCHRLHHAETLRGQGAGNAQNQTERAILQDLLDLRILQQVADAHISLMPTFWYLWSKDFCSHMCKYKCLGFAVTQSIGQEWHRFMGIIDVSSQAPFFVNQNRDSLFERSVILQKALVWLSVLSAFILCWNMLERFKLPSGPLWRNEQNQTSALHSSKRRTKMSPWKTEVKMDRTHCLRGFIHQCDSFWRWQKWCQKVHGLQVAVPKEVNCDRHSISWARAKLKSPEV